MAEYVTIDIASSADDFAAATYQDLQSQWPDWTPSDANLETWLTEAYARIASEVSILGHTVAENIFREFGRKIVGIPPDLAVSASVDSTWTMVDNAGYTVPQGTLVTIARTGDEREAFEVVSDVVVAPGDTATAAGAVVLSALIPGTQADGLTADPELVNALPYVEGVASAGTTSGGQDEESEEEYTGRLVEELRLMSPTPILPDEFATLAKRHPSVHRALSVDLWNPADDTLDNERYVGTVCLDEAGEDVSGGVKADVEADLLAKRETNFEAPVGAPDYFLIDVTVVGTAKPGYQTASVDAVVTAAIQDYLDPAKWGKETDADSDTSWTNRVIVRRNELIWLCENQPGMDYVTTLTLAISPAALGVVDLNLASVVALTRPDTIDVTVNAP